MEEIIEGQLVRVDYLVNVSDGNIISTNDNYKNEPEYKRDFSIRRLSTWIRVKFIDSDGTFIGEAERVERNTWSEVVITIFKTGQQVKISMDRVSETEEVGKDFCYSDNVTQCSCPGTCRNK